MAAEDVTVTREGRPPLPSSRKRRGLEKAVLLGPGLTYLVVMLVVPLGIIISYTVFRRGTFGGIVTELNLDNFARLFDPLFLRIVLKSLRIAFTTTVVALLMAYPAAYAVASLPRRWRTPALVFVVLPFWSNFLIRTYAWIVLLNREGLINNLLEGIGVIAEPLALLYNEPAIHIGLLYAYLPLAILPIYASIERLDLEVIEAAKDLGAGPLRTFLTVTLPLTLPGLMAGAIFVFVPSLGNFVVPELLGGGQAIMVGNLIRDQFLKARDWPFGAVLAMALIAFMMVLLVIQAVILKRTRERTVDA